jgi:hypothetical protein
MQPCCSVAGVFHTRLTRRAHGALSALALALLSACSEPAPKPAEAPVNLAGFPPAFKEGYMEGCDSARRGGTPRRDAKRYAEDPQYAAGWRDGLDMCKANKK